MWFRSVTLCFFAHTSLAFVRLRSPRSSANELVRLLPRVRFRVRIRPRVERLVVYVFTRKNRRTDMLPASVFKIYNRIYRSRWCFAYRFIPCRLQCVSFDFQNGILCTLRCSIAFTIVSAMIGGILQIACDGHNSTALQLLFPPYFFNPHRVKRRPYGVRIGFGGLSHGSTSLVEPRYSDKPLSLSCHALAMT